MKKKKIENKLKKKTNKELVETIILSKKNKEWLNISHKISVPKRKKVVVNLNDIDSQSKEGDNIVVPGKVLGNGSLNKKINLSALSFSQTAIEKLSKAGIKTSLLKDEIKKNKDVKDIKIVERRIKR